MNTPPPVFVEVARCSPNDDKAKAHRRVGSGGVTAPKTPGRDFRRRSSQICTDFKFDSDAPPAKGAQKSDSESVQICEGLWQELLRIYFAASPRCALFVFVAA